MLGVGYAVIPNNHCQVGGNPPKIHHAICYLWSHVGCWFEILGGGCVGGGRRRLSMKYDNALEECTVGGQLGCMGGASGAGRAAHGCGRGCT